MKLKVQLYSPEAASTLCSEVVAVYQEVYCREPYNATPERVRAFSESWPTKTMRPGLVFAGATGETGNLLGFAYGWPTVTGERWNTLLRAELRDEAEEWLSDCFEFCELAVTSSAQGFGAGRALMKTVFSHVNNRTALLLTHRSTTRASEMYKRDGWHVLRDSFQLEGGNPLAIMVKKLEPAKG